MKRSNQSTSSKVTKELQDRLQDILDLTEDALDPELTREDVVAKVKEIANIAADEDIYEIDADEDDSDDSNDNSE